jgi:flagellar hook assembly protein FlgD
MSNRVLARFTAFLALEPWMRDSIFGGDDENQDGHATDVVDEIELLKAEFSISVSPNPARESARITLSSGVDVTVSSIQIYDMKGSIVRHIDPPSYPIKGEHTIFWDLFDDYGNQIQNGTYYIIVNVGLKSFTYKVVVSR